MKVNVILSAAAERDLMRKIGWEGRWTFDHFADWLHSGRDSMDLGQDAKKMTKRMVADLVERRLIERATDCKVKRWGRKYRYRLTEAGHRLAAKKMLKRIARAKAEQVISALIERAKAINARPELLLGVLRIRVFGSYLKPRRTTLGDVDVAVDYARKAQGEDHMRWNEERVRTTAPESIKDDFFKSLFWGDTEVERLLKNRDRYLHFSRPGMLKQDHMRVRGRVIFEVKLEEIAGMRNGGPLLS